MDNIFKESPASDRKLWHKGLERLKGNQVLAYFFILFAITSLGVLFFKEISWQSASVLITLIICLTIIIAKVFSLSSKNHKEDGYDDLREMLRKYVLDMADEEIEEVVDSKKLEKYSTKPK